MSIQICRTGLPAVLALAGVVHGVAEKAPVSELPPIVVTASPFTNTLVELAQPVTVLADERLQERLAATLGDTLAAEPGISPTYYGPNASRPVIRGLGGDHLRVLQNGLSTMDVSATSADHAVAQDPLTVTTIEVVRGPAALMYGPTAVGGAVNVLDNRIPSARLDAPVTGQLEGRYLSVSDGWSGAGVVEGGQAGVNYHLNGFARTSDNARIPGFARSRRLRLSEPLPPGETEARNRLPNSQAQSEGGTAGLSYVWEKGYIGGAVQGLASDYGIVAEKDVTIELRQVRGDFAGRLEEPVRGLRAVQWKFGLADYRHTEFEGATPGTTFNLDAWNGRLEALHEPVGRLEGALGYEARRDKLDVKGDEAFLPPTESWGNSIFLYEEAKWSAVRLQFGGRYDQSRIEAPGQTKNFHTGSGAAGVVYRPVEAYSGAVNFSYTQRAPVAQELFADGPHLATDAYEVGDPTLRPERSYGLDVTLRKETGRVTGTLTFFFTHFENFISLTPRGVNDPVDDLPIYDYASFPADFIGGEASVVIHLLDGPRHRLHLELKSDYTHATNADTDRPLPRIPPWRYGGEVRYEWGTRWSASLHLLRAQAQERNAPNELPTDGYTMLDLSATYRLRSGPVTWDLWVKGTNLLDEEARVATSFLKDISPLPGRGAVVAVRANF
jgi:iron complex outermembrane receptor protein